MIPEIQITDIGYIVPTTEQINAGAWQLLDTSMGGNLSRVQGTFQHQLVTSITAMVKEFYDKQVQLANQFDPKFATGIYQEAIGELSDLTRDLATRSICPVVFRGLVGVVIPNGFIVQDLTGRNWRTSGQYNIGTSGTVVITCICDVAGAIEALPHSINRIVSALNGLDSVDNEDSAVMGFDEESPVDFEVRRQESLEKNAKMTDDSVRGNVLAVRDVVDCYAISNPTDQTVSIGETNYQAIRNSITVSVVGGSDYDVAKAAFIKAGTGCAWNGNTPIRIFAEEYPVNPPHYDLKILRPDFIDIHIKVIIKDPTSLSYPSETEAKNHILESSQSGENRVRIGKNLIPSDYICGMPKIGIKSIVASFDGVDWKDELPIGIDQYPSLDAFRITFKDS